MIRKTDIYDSNPWWRDKTLIQSDKKILDWKNSIIQYDPRLRHVIKYDFDPDNTVVYTLRGPRQVGKTTLLKLQIRDFIEHGIDPWNIFYHSLDLANDKQDIVDIVETYLDISLRQRGNKRSYLFLDEASSIPDWQKGIKYLIDNDKLKNCTVMVTGSQAINLKHATETLPGRRGTTDNTYDNILLPMKFAEYACLLNKDVGKLTRDNYLLEYKKRKDIFKELISGEINENLDKLNAYQNELNKLLCEYMLTGGTPKIITEKIKNNTIHENIYTNYLKGITGQWDKLKKDERLLKEFGSNVVHNLGSHNSWSSLVKQSQLGSVNTVKDYAHTLSDLFVLSIIPLYGEKNKEARIQKDKKFYFHDPFYVHIFNGLKNLNENFYTSLKYLEDKFNQSRIIEGIVADHLIRLAFSLSKKKQTFDYNNHLFYWKDHKNHEVDFVLYDGDTIEVPIEVKYRNKIHRNDLSGLTNFLIKTTNKKGLVLSKTLLEIKEDYVIIPVSVFLLLI